ncbi:MAG: glucose 1-dehydrogenase [Spirosomataceae bacterium]|jgi:glucose 1-dehydrogenase
MKFYCFIEKHSHGKMDQTLENQVAVVTGSSSGIGRAVVKELAKRGASVVVNYRSSKEEAEEVQKEIEAEGGKAIVVQADISIREDVDKLISETLSAYNRLDIMVANAGIQVDAPFLEMDLEQWNKVISVNLTGQFLATHAAAKQFVKQNPTSKESETAIGKIICMSSVHDMIPWAGHVNYAASKGGVLMFMKSIAQELAPLKIRVNAISPGAIKTSINKAAWGTEASLKALMELVPYKRIGKPEDIAKAAAWLVSDDADYVTGETLYIDGGMMLYPEFADNG